MDLKRKATSSSSPYYCGTRQEVAQFLPSHYTKVLEIGCGEGGFRTYVGPCEYWGIEPNRAAASIARTVLFRVIEGTYQEAFEHLPNHHFDLVICNDVIEHMANPEEFLASITEKMTVGATLVGSIPNVRFVGNLFELLFLKDWQYKDQGILDRTHLKFFTHKSLRCLFQNHGFLVEELRGINGVPVGIFQLRLLLKNLFILVMGCDSRFLQFGFRVRSAMEDKRLKSIHHARLTKAR